MATVARAEGAGIWTTIRESSLAVKTVLVGVFVSRLGGFLNIFLVLFLTAEGYSVTQAAFALGVYGAGAMVGVLIGGALADRLGARTATIISMASTAALTASLLYLPSYPLILAAAALVGLAGQIYRPAAATLLSDLTPAGRQNMIFAMYRFGLNVGAMAAPLIGFGLYHLNSEQYTLLFWGEAAIALAYGALAWLTLPARTVSSETSTVEVGGGAGMAGDDAGTTAPAEAASTYAAVLRDRRYLLYLVAMFFNSAVYVQYVSTLPLDLTTAGVEIFWYTFAVSLNGLIVIILELPVTKITQHWPYRLAIATAFGLVGVGFALYALPFGPMLIVIATVVWTMGEIVGGPAAFAYPAVAGPAYLKSRYIGSFQFVFGLGTAVGPMLGGALFAQLGHGVWPVIAIGSLLAVVFTVVGVRDPRHEQAAVPDAVVVPSAEMAASTE